MSDLYRGEGGVIRIFTIKQVIRNTKTVNFEQKQVKQEIKLALN